MRGASGMTPRTTCTECGEELWGPGEANGLCLTCKDREREALDDDAYEFGDEIREETATWGDDQFDWSNDENTECTHWRTEYAGQSMMKCQDCGALRRP